MIKIATAIRHWICYDWRNKHPGDTVVVCMAVVELWYDPDMVQFRVKYREWTDRTRTMDTGEVYQGVDEPFLPRSVDVAV